VQGVAVLRLLQQQALHTHRDTEPDTSFTSCTSDALPPFNLVSAGHRAFHLGYAYGCLYLILGEELGPQWPPQCPQLQPPALLVHLHRHNQRPQAVALDSSLSERGLPLQCSPTSSHVRTCTSPPSVHSTRADNCTSHACTRYPLVTPQDACPACSCTVRIDGSSLFEYSMWIGT
jgi:hypothetical protein